MSDLVGNSEDRFSYDAAHMEKYKEKISLNYHPIPFAEIENRLLEIVTLNYTDFQLRVIRVNSYRLMLSSGS